MLNLKIYKIDDDDDASDGMGHPKPLTRAKWDSLIALSHIVGLTQNICLGYCVVLRFSITISTLASQAIVSFFTLSPSPSLSIDANRLKL